MGTGKAVRSPTLCREKHRAEGPFRRKPKTAVSRGEVSLRARESTSRIDDRVDYIGYLAHQRMEADMELRRLVIRHVPSSAQSPNWGGVEARFAYSIDP